MLYSMCFSHFSSPLPLVLCEVTQDESLSADDTASESTTTGHVISEGKDQVTGADVTIGQAETVLDVMEQETKLK